MTYKNVTYYKNTKHSPWLVVAIFQLLSQQDFMTFLEDVTCKLTSTGCVVLVTRWTSSRAHLVCTLSRRFAWRRAQCTDGAAEGATLCCSFEPLTSTVVAARPPCSPRQCVSLCVCSCVWCLSVSLPVYVCFLCVWHDGNLTSPLLTASKIQDRACTAIDTQVHIWFQCNLRHSCGEALKTCIALINVHLTWLEEQLIQIRAVFNLSTNN